MADHKQAGDLVPGDIFIERRRYRKVRQQTYRVVAVMPGAASTVVDVTVVIPGRGQCRTFAFYRGNRVEMVNSRGLHFVRLAGED